MPVCWLLGFENLWNEPVSPKGAFNASLRFFKLSQVLPSMGTNQIQHGRPMCGRSTRGSLGAKAGRSPGPLWLSPLLELKTTLLNHL